MKNFIKFDGQGDYLTLADTEDWKFGQESITLDGRYAINIHTGRYVGYSVLIRNWSYTAKYNLLKGLR